MKHKTRAERLAAIVSKVQPALVKAHAATGGKWDGTAPYVIEGPGPLPATQYSPALAAGMRRVKVTSVDGDSYAGVGPTVEAAIAALEQKLGLGAKE